MEYQMIKNDITRVVVSAFKLIDQQNDEIQYLRNRIERMRARLRELQDNDRRDESFKRGDPGHPDNDMGM